MVVVVIYILSSISRIGDTVEKGRKVPKILVFFPGNKLGITVEKRGKESPGIYLPFIVRAFSLHGFK